METFYPLQKVGEFEQAKRLFRPRCLIFDDWCEMFVRQIAVQVGMRFGVPEDILIVRIRPEDLL